MKTFKNIYLPVVTASLAIVMSGFGSCSMSMSEVCATRFAEFDRKTTNAVAVLEPLSRSGRGLASETLHETLQLEQSPQAWQAWAEELLKETQHYMDAVEAASGSRLEAGQIVRDLNLLANDIVAFHGYAGQSDVDRMMAVLDKIQTQSARIRQMACRG